MPEINFMPKTCGIVDERSEIASIYKGVAQNDVGMFTDVIVCDEIGKKEDVQAIEKMMLSGVKGIFTAHAGSFFELNQNENLRKIIENKIIKKIIILDKREKGKIKEMIDLEKI